MSASDFDPISADAGITARVDFDEMRYDEDWEEEYELSKPEPGPMRRELTEPPEDFIRGAVESQLAMAYVTRIEASLHARDLDDSLIAGISDDVDRGDTVPRRHDLHQPVREWVIDEFDLERVGDADGDVWSTTRTVREAARMVPGTAIWWLDSIGMIDGDLERA